VIELDLLQQHDDCLHDHSGDDPADDQDDQEQQNLRNRVEYRVQQILEALAHAHVSKWLIHEKPPVYASPPDVTARGGLYPDG
jgi:hypothetical protein